MSETTVAAQQTADPRPADQQTADPRPADQQTADQQPADQQPAQWVTLPDVAEKLDLSISKVRQMVREGTLLAVRREGILRVPSELVANSTVLKHLPGILTLLRDAGYNDEEALRWLYQHDETLRGGTPARTLGGDGAREVKRRAQALGF